MHAIVLAAGQGTRMAPLTDHTPKSLLPIGNNVMLVRLIGQILERSSDDVTVIVGHEKERVAGIVRDSFKERVSIIENNNYHNDVNILSLSLAVLNTDEPFIVFEADCLFDDAAMDRIFDPSLENYSSWYTMGSFLSSQVGGIVKADNDDSVLDVRVVPNYSDEYSHGYDKLIGVLKVGPNEVRSYLDFLRKEVAIDTKQYYLAPWIKNLDSLPCKATSLAKYRVGAFNTPDEYYSVLKVFGEEEHHV